MLGLVECPVGAVEHLLDAVIVARALRRADAHRDPARRPAVGLEPDRANGVEHALDQSGDMVRIRMPDQDREFLAAEPAEQVGRPDLFAHGTRETHEYLVAGGMPVLVVDRLEVIDVE